MPGKPILTAAVSLIILFSGTLSAQNKSHPALQKTKKIEAVKPTDFKHSDVGNPALAGTVTTTGDGFDITAGGSDVWGVKDEFNFVYIEKRGDFDFAGRVEGLTSANLYTKAGIMARESLSPGSRHIYFQIFPDNSPRNKNNGGFEFQYRQVTDGQMKAIYPTRSEGTPEFPVSFPNTWIRLKRTGNNFTGYTGTDGKNWKEYTTFTLDLPAKIYLGAAVTSHNTAAITTAKFRNAGYVIK